MSTRQANAMYVVFGTEDGTSVAVELDAAVRGWSDLANAFVFALNRCSDLTSKPQIVPSISDACTVISVNQMAQWLRRCGVPF